MTNNAYTFADVLIEPQYSEVLSRSKVDLTTILHKWKLKLPVVASNMKTICGPKMAIEIAKHGGMGILHRFNHSGDAQTEYKEVVEAIEFWPEYAGAVRPDLPIVGVSIGVKESDEERAESLYDVGARIFCIDVAHGHHVHVKRMITHLKGLYPDITIIAGNIATYQATIALAQWGADVVKVGIGPSPVCLTRTNTGVGVPQLYALEQVRKAITDHNLSINIIADGGVNTVGSIAKALKFADAVMLGTMLSGTTETPGKVFKNPDGQFYKVYGGSASGESKGENKFVEGLMKPVPFRGKVKYILREIKEGLQSAFSYSDANNLKEFQANCQFTIPLSEGAMRESKM